jgi:hypothetical protein
LIIKKRIFKKHLLKTLCSLLKRWKVKSEESGRVFVDFIVDTDKVIFDTINKRVYIK